MFKYVLKKMSKEREAIPFIIMILLSFSISTVSPYLNGMFIDFLTYNRNIKDVFTFAIVIAVVGIGGSVLSFYANIISIKIMTKTSYSVLYEYTQRILRTDLMCIERFKASYLSQRILTDIDVVVTFVISNFLTSILNIVFILYVIFLFFRMSIVLLLIVGALLFPYIVLTTLLKEPLLSSSKLKKEESNAFFATLSSQIENVFFVQLNSWFEISENKLKNAYNKFLPAILRAGKYSYLFSSIDGTISILFQSILLVFGGVQIIRGQMSIGEFVMTNSYFSLLLKSVEYFTGYFKQRQEALASYKRMIEIWNLPQMPQMSIAKGFAKEIKKIELKNLAFKYDHTEKHIISNMNYIFQSGTTYSVIGENGAGKSTLLKIITGLYHHEGNITYDDCDERNYDMIMLRKKSVVVVPQTLYVANETVGEYMAEALNISESELTKLIDEGGALAGFAHEISAILNQSCRSLSGGELRKLHLWIAVNKKIDILIFDEPTTALDREGKKELIEYISTNPNHKMIIIMTHDPSVINVTDAVCNIGKNIGE